jgi:hypothetical protein
VNLGQAVMKAGGDNDSENDVKYLLTHHNPAVSFLLFIL